MKSIILFLFVMFFTAGSYAQTWSGTTPGNINYTSGNVGIGSDVPNYKLTIVSPTGNYFASALLSSSIGTPGNWVGQLYGYNGNSYQKGATIFESLDGNGRGKFHIALNNAANSSNVTLADSKLTVQYDGNVGIGVTNPGSLLQVGYGLKLMSDGTMNWGSAAGYGRLTWDTGKAIIHGQAGKDLSLGANDTFDQLYIKSGGNVGIGTTNPEAKLTVKGKIVASEIQVKEIGTIPDYVFRPTYKLMPLTHVEDFVKKNYHLPEVPSEKEFKENGMNMAEMNTLLLKKIEELTLYAIDQNKQIANQNKQLQDQNKKILNLDKKVEELSKKSKKK